MLLNIIFFILLFTIFTLFFLKNNSFFCLKQFSLVSAGAVLIVSCLLVITFDTNQPFFQHLMLFDSFGLSKVSFFYFFGFDGISLYFFFLSSFLIFVCILFI